jgi:hypothetical protein
MVLFAICLSVAALVGLFRARPGQGQFLALTFVLAYLAVHLPGMLGGLVRGADLQLMFTEWQQSLYWLAAPFFALVLQSQRMVVRTARLVQFAGVMLALVYIFILVAVLAGVVDFVAIYKHLAETGEFVSRGGNFVVYKGFLYLGVAIVFLVAIRPRHWAAWSVLTGIALVMTLTRGFLLSTAVAVLLLLLAQRRTLTFTFGLMLALGAAFLVWVYLPTLTTGLVSGRAASNNQRIEDALFIWEHATAVTLFLGEGFGSLIIDRPLIENTFLWALWKLGLVGMFFWMAPMLVCAYYFARMPRNENYRLACAYFFGTLLVYLQTMTNPYLNNPIGLSFVMMALFALRTLAHPGDGSKTSAAAAPPAPRPEPS